MTASAPTPAEPTVWAIVFKERIAEMGAGYNTQKTITVEGPDESEAVAVLENLFERKFEEE